MITEELLPEFELDSTIVNNSIYKNYITMRVKKDIEKGLLTKEEISFSMIGIPDELYEGEDKDFLVDCKGTSKRLAISKTGNNLVVLLARDIEDFPIY